MDKPVANLHLWDMVEKTDPKYTKDFNRGGFEGTAISPTYVFKRLTELFGPCGDGWRFVIEDDAHVAGPGYVTKTVTTTVKDGVTIVCEEASDNREILHVIRGHIAYRKGEEWKETGSYFGQTKIVQRTKNGLLFDEEAKKKSVTDCLTKCATQLGIAADVHMGKFDDSKYVDKLTKEFEDEPLLVSDGQVEELKLLMKGAGLSEAVFLKKYAIKAVKDLPHPIFKAACDEIAAYKAKKAAENPNQQEPEHEVHHRKERPNPEEA